jgi:hypothetical protein
MEDIYNRKVTLEEGLGVGDNTCVLLDCRLRFSALSFVSFV